MAGGRLHCSICTPKNQAVHALSCKEFSIVAVRQCIAGMPGGCPVHVLGSNTLFHYFRYSDEQIPGVLYASVNPEYMTSTDGKAATSPSKISLFLFFSFFFRSGDEGLAHTMGQPCNQFPGTSPFV